MGAALRPVLARREPGVGPHGIHDHDARAAAREVGEEPLHGEEDRRAGVGEHERGALARVRGVDGHVGAARLEDGEQRDRQLERALHEDAHPHVGADTEAHQVVGEVVRARVELAVGERALGQHDRDGVGRARRLRLAELVEEDIAAARARGVVPRVEPAPLGGGEDGEAAEGRLGGGEEALEQRRQVAEQALDGRRVEAAGVVADAELQRALEDAGEGERVRRQLLALGVRERERVLLGAGARRARDGEVLEDDQALEERGAAGHGGEGLHLDERAVLVVAQLGLVLLEVLEPGERGRVGAHPGAHGEGVDEEPDHPLDAGHRRRPARHGGAEDHVLLAAEAREQDGPRALDQRAQGEPVVAREGRERSALGLGQGQALLAGAGRAAVRRVVDAERRGRGEALELAAPEGFVAAAVLLGQPADEVAVRARPIEVDLAPGGAGLVAREQLLDDDLHRPAVEEQVVHAPHEAVRVVGEAQQRDPQQGRARRVEAAVAILLFEAAHALGLLRAGEGAQVLIVHGELEAPPHDLDRLIELLPGERRAERGVPLHEVLEGVVERGDVEVAPQGPGDLHDVGPGLGGVEGVEEDPLLQGRQRVDVLDVVRPHATARGVLRPRRWTRVLRGRAEREAAASMESPRLPQPARRGVASCGDTSRRSRGRS